jgi:hypothetical protein
MVGHVVPLPPLPDYPTLGAPGDENDDALMTVANLLAGHPRRPDAPNTAEPELPAGTPPELRDDMDNSLPLEEAKPSAIQQAALRQALRAASQANSKLESIQLEMVKVRDRLQRTEQVRLSQALAYRSQSASNESQLQSLRHDLAAAVAQNKSLQSRWWLGRQGWLSLGATFLAIAACTFVAYHPEYLKRSTASRTDASDVIAPVRQPQPLAKNTGAQTSSIPAGGQSAEEKALDRLDRAMTGIPPQEAGSILGKANQKLQASGRPPCTTRQVDGRASLVVTGGSAGGSKGEGMLAAALTNCADAVEQVSP